LVSYAISGLHNASHGVGASVGLVACSGGNRIVLGWIKRLTVRLNLFHPLLLKELHGSAVRKLQPTPQILGNRSFQSPFQIVDNLQKSGEQSLALILDLDLGQSLLALAVVLHLGLEAEGSIPPLRQFVLMFGVVRWYLWCCR
jgi:hypothetical protein